MKKSFLPVAGFSIGVFLFGVAAGGFVAWSYAHRREHSARVNVDRDINRFTREVEAELTTLQAQLREREREIAKITQNYRERLAAAPGQAQPDASAIKAASGAPTPGADAVLPAQLAWESAGLRRGEFEQKLKTCREELAANRTLSDRARDHLQELIGTFNALSRFSQQPEQRLMEFERFVADQRRADEETIRRKPTFCLRLAAIFSSRARQRLREHQQAKGRHEALQTVEVYLSSQVRRLAVQLRSMTGELEKSSRTVEGMLNGTIAYRDEKALEFLILAEAVAKIIEQQLGGNTPKG